MKIFSAWNNLTNVGQILTTKLKNIRMENLLTPILLLTLILVFFCTGVISVVTGCTSLITVPVMLQMGIEPDVAIATNMLALTFLSLGVGQKNSILKVYPV